MLNLYLKDSGGLCWIAQHLRILQFVVFDKRHALSLYIDNLGCWDHIVMDVDDVVGDVGVPHGLDLTPDIFLLHLGRKNSQFHRELPTVRQSLVFQLLNNFAACQGAFCNFLED